MTYFQSARLYVEADEPDQHIPDRTLQNIAGACARWLEVGQFQRDQHNRQYLECSGTVDAKFDPQRMLKEALTGNLNLRMHLILVDTTAWLPSYSFLFGTNHTEIQCQTAIDLHYTLLEVALQTEKARSKYDFSRYNEIKTP